MEITMKTETWIAGKAAFAEDIKAKVSSEQIILGAVMLLAGALLIFAVGFAQGAGGLCKSRPGPDRSEGSRHRIYGKIRVF